MKLLIIECGNSKLSLSISTAAAKLKPKPEFVSTMTIDLEGFNVAAFKRELFYLAPDTIVLNPPTWEPNQMKWGALLSEVIRQNDVMSGRLLFVSSVEVLGDSQLRTEGAIEMPWSDRGEFLHESEMLIESSTSRHYIMRFPDLTDTPYVRVWAGPHPPGYCGANEMFTLMNLEDMGSVIIDRVQTGWFGKYHVTPNDYLILSDLTGLEYDKTKRIPDYSLASKYTWPVAKSKDTWDKLVAEVTSCEASRT